MLTSALFRHGKDRNVSLQGVFGQVMARPQKSVANTLDFLDNTVTQFLLFPTFYPRQALGKLLCIPANQEPVLGRVAGMLRLKFTTKA